jgi:hypothetical protein
MGEASSTDDDRHGPSLGLAIGLNAAINAVLNAGFGLLLAWLHWQDYELAWYNHDLHPSFELGFVAEDLVFQGVSVGIVVTLIVAAIIHRQWDAGHLQRGRVDGFLLPDERTRGRHLLAWTGAMALMGFTVSIGFVALLATGVGKIPGSTFALVRTVDGFLVGGIAGGLVTASWGTNLSAGRLVTGEGPTTTVARAFAGARRRPWAVLAAVGLVTVAFGVGLADVDTDVSEPDTMPRGTGDHRGAEALAGSFNRTHELGFTWHFSVDPDGCRADDRANLPSRPTEQAACGNVTDEVYVRAMEEAFSFLAEYRYEAEGNAFLDDAEGPAIPDEAQRGLPTFVKLANWSIAGGQGQAPDDAYALPSPDDRARSQAAREQALDELGDQVEATIGEDAEQARVHYQVDPGTELSGSQLGAFATDARDAYVDRAETNGEWQVFTGDNAPTVTVDRQAANAHQASELDADAGEVLAVAGLGLLLGAAVVFRDPLAGLLVAGTVGLALAWTGGLLGHAGVPLSELDLAFAPIVLAAGIAFTVPTIESVLQRVEGGEEVASAIEATGRQVAFPLSIGALAAGAGLVALGLSPTAVVADAAWTTLFGVLAAFALTVTLVPAVLGLKGTSGRLLSFEAASSEAGSKGLAVRGVAAVVVIALTLASLTAASGLSPQSWGQAVETWPADDDRRGEHEQAMAGYHGVSQAEAGFADHAIVLTGEVTHPEALAYKQRLAEELAAQAEQTDALRAEAAVPLSDVMRDWLAICCPAEDATTPGVEEPVQPPEEADQDRYPTTQEEVEAMVAEMVEAPYEPTVRPVIAEPTGPATVLAFDARTGDRAEASWSATQAAIEAAEPQRPNDVQTAVVGPAAEAQLTAEEQVPWAMYALAAASATAGVLALGYTREVTGTLAVLLAVGLAGVWGLGVLVLVDTPVTVASTSGLVVGLLVAGAWSTRRAWGKEGFERVGVFTLALLVGVLAGLLALLEASAGFPSPIAKDALRAAIASTGAGYAAQALVGRALVTREPEPEGTRVVEASSK